MADVVAVREYGFALSLGDFADAELLSEVELLIACEDKPESVAFAVRFSDETS